MKRLLISTAAATAIAAAIAAPASAADLANRYPVKAPVMVAPVFSWTGFYIGGNAGYGGDKYNYQFAGPAAASNGGNSVSSSGFIAGGQAGYNYQFVNNVVVGVETDIQWTGIEGDYNSFRLNGSSTNLKSSLDYFGTVRARVGYAFDRFLPYVTGGFAYGKTKTTVNAFSDSSTDTGWTVGGGVEYAFANNWTFKTEYLYVDLGNDTYAAPTAPLNTVNVDSKYHTVRAGVNYKF